MQTIDVWGNTLLNAMTALWTEVAAFMPNLLGAILILAIGYVVSRLVRVGLRRLLAALGIDRFSKNAGVTDILDHANIDTTVSDLLARVVFWILMLTFVVSATETLGMPRVSQTVDSLVQYLPNLLGAAFILLTGLFVAGFARDLIRTAAQGIGIDYARTLGTFVYALVVVLVISLAIGQLELETEILTQAISIVLLAVGGAAAIAFGFGSRDVASHVLSGTYVREAYRAGDVVRIGDTEGTVKLVGAVSTVIVTEDGYEFSVPNAHILSSTTRKKA